MCASQERIVQLFEKNTYSVVNIFDVTLRPRLNVGGAVEVAFIIAKISICSIYLSSFHIMLTVFQLYLLKGTLLLAKVNRFT